MMTARMQRLRLFPILGPPVLGSLQEGRNHKSPKELVVGMLICGGLLLGLVLVVVAILYRRKKKYGGFFILTLPPRPDYIMKLDPERSLLEQTNMLPYDALWEFPRERIHKGR